MGIFIGLILILCCLGAISWARTRMGRGKGGADTARKGEHSRGDAAAGNTEAAGDGFADVAGGAQAGRVAGSAGAAAGSGAAGAGDVVASAHNPMMMKHPRTAWASQSGAMSPQTAAGGARPTLTQQLSFAAATGPLGGAGARRSMAASGRRVSGAAASAGGRGGAEAVAASPSQADDDVVVVEAPRAALSAVTLQPPPSEAAAPAAQEV